jgi:hypothetical protein
MRQIIPVPDNTRAMLLLFAFYETEPGLPSLLNRLDYSGVSRRQIVAAALGRLPEDPKAAADGANFVPRPALANILQGAEFQTRFREIILHAFPEKRRSIFIHIPKCAGTDLITGLRGRMPTVHLHTAIPHMTPKPDLFRTLREIVAGLPFSDTIAVSGHVPLRWYRDRDLVRFQDDLYTVMREPRSLIYSYISFILTRLKNFAGIKRNDTTQWLKGIGMTEVTPDPSPAYLLELGSRLLRSSEVTSRNMICNNMGRGQVADAMEAMALTNIEITDTARYSSWKAAKFGLPSIKRLNESLPLYTPELAPREDRDFIEDMVREDSQVYATVLAALERTGALSVHGSALA